MWIRIYLRIIIIRYFDYRYIKYIKWHEELYEIIIKALHMQNSVYLQ